MGRSLRKLTLILALFTFWGSGKSLAQTPNVEHRLTVKTVQLSGSMAQCWTTTGHSATNQNLAAGTNSIKFGFSSTNNTNNVVKGITCAAFKANETTNLTKTYSASYTSTMSTYLEFTDTRAQKFDLVSFGGATSGTGSVAPSGRDPALNLAATSARNSGGTTTANASWDWQWRYTSGGPTPTVTASQTEFCNIASGVSFTAPAYSYRGMIYSWEQRVGTTGTWQTAIGTSDGQNYTMQGSISVTMQYRRVDLYRNTYSGTAGYIRVESAPVTITVEDEPSGTRPSSMTVCAGKSINASIGGYNPGSYMPTIEWSTDATFADPGQIMQTGSSPTLTALAPLGLPFQDITVRALYSGVCGANAEKVFGTFRVTYVQPSVAPTSMTTTASTLCSGETATLTMVGGTLGGGARYEWSTSSDFSPLVHTSSISASYDVTPTANTTYYGRIGNTSSPCDANTSSVSTAITVVEPSTAPDKILATQSYYCDGSTTPVTLQVDGGALGTNAQWEWYLNGDLNTSVHTGASYQVYPSATTEYSVRAVGTAAPCDAVTDTASVTIDFRSASDISSATVSSSTNGSCEGTEIDLEITGGTLGYGAQWVWYAGGCANGTPIGTGSIIQVTPATDTEYFVRAEGDCNNTACESISIDVYEQSVDPTGITLSPTRLCLDDVDVTFEREGGKAGTGIVWNWYLISSTNDTTFYIEANSVTINLFDLWYTYDATYVMLVGETDGSAGTIPLPCVSRTQPVSIDISNLTYDDYPVVTSVTPDTDLYCESGTPELTATGQIYGYDFGGNFVTHPDSRYVLYDGDPTLGTTTALDSNQTGVFNPLTTETTTYYVVAKNACGDSAPESVTITITVPSEDPSSITADIATVCSDDNAVELTVNGGSLGTDANWTLYDEDPTAGTPTSIADNTTGVFNVTPSATTTYYVRFEGNATPCDATGSIVSTTVTVNNPSVAPTEITSAGNIDSICNGANTDVTLTADGTLGTDAVYVWATDAGFNDILVGENTASIIVSPTTTTTYYTKIDSTATPCTDVSGTVVNFEITVNDPSVDPTGLTADVNTVCSDANAVELTVDGGSLGTDANWTLYNEDPTAGTPVAIDNNTTGVFNVTPGVTTTYYVRFEGSAAPCDATGSIVSTTVTVNVTSEDPDALLADINTVCSDANAVELTLVGGVLGTDASWTLYDEDPTAGTPVAVESNNTTGVFNVAPSETTTYYVRYEGSAAPCDATGSVVSTTVTVNVTSEDPDALLADINTVCSDANAVELSVDGGSLGTDANWTLYDEDPTAGTPAALESNLTGVFNVTPSATTTYYVRFEDGVTPCDTTGSVVSTTVTVNDASVAPTEITATLDSICNGDNTDVTLTADGTAGTGAAYVWATDAIFNEIIVGEITASITVSPNTTTTYYAKIEGSTAPCVEVSGTVVSFELTVSDPSVDPSSLTADINTVCSDANAVELTVNGGTLGTDATWTLYNEDPTAGTPAALESNLTGVFNVTPSATTTYYVRFEGSAAPCDTTGNIVSTTITVNDPSVDPIDLTADVSTICTDDNDVELTVNGGSLGTAANWTLYNEDPTAGTPVAIDNNTTGVFNVTPGVTTTYYVRFEGGQAPCDTTGSVVSTTVSVNVTSENPDALLADINTVCSDANAVELTVDGGSLGTAANWTLYDEDPTAGTPAAIDNNTTGVFNVTPSTTTTYYVRFEGGVAPCDATGSVVTTTVTVNNPSSDPTDLTADISTVCSDANAVELTVDGGSLGTAANWTLYDEDPTAGTPAALESNLTGVFNVTPSATTTYYVRFEDGVAPCDTTGSVVSTTVTVNDASVAPTEITATLDSICNGDNTDVTLTADGTLGTGAAYVWATDAIFNEIIVGEITASITVSPNTTTTYYALIDGYAAPCGDVSGTVVSFELTVTDPSVDPTGLTADISDVCSATNVELTVDGGTLGTDATWTLYNEDPTAGTPTAVESNNTTGVFNVTPSVTTTYYVRYEGSAAPCDTTGNVVSTTITVNDPSVDPTGLTADVATVCSDANAVELTVNDGTLGAGSVWALYVEDPTPGTSTSIDDNTTGVFNVTPSETTTYYVRFEGGQAPCDATGNVVSTTVTVNDPSVDPTGLTADISTVCSDANAVELTVDGGTLGTDASWTLYDEDPTAGTPAAIDNNTTGVFNVTPATNTTYYVRYEGSAAPCDTTGNVVSTTITVNEPSVDATSLTADNSTICSNDNAVELTVNGGSLGTAANWTLYDEDPTAGTPAAIDNNTTGVFNVTPGVTTTYYVRFEGSAAPCDATGSIVSTTVTVSELSDTPTDVQLSTATPCYGEEVVLTQIDGVLNSATAYFEWATDDQFTNVITQTAEDTIHVNVTGLDTYYVRVVDATCGASAYASTTIDWLQGATTVFGTGLTPNSIAVSVCNVSDNNWHYFVDNNGNVVAAINSGGQDLGEVEWTVEVGNNGPYTNPLNTLCTDGEFYVGRNYSFETENKATTAIGVKLFMTPAEYTTFKNISDGEGGLYEICYGSTETPADLQVSSFYEFNQGNPGEAIFPTVDMNAGPGGSHEYTFTILPKYGGARMNTSGKGNVNPDHATDLYLHNTGGRGAVLPIELTSFTATKVSEGVLLNWNTASELNNDRFEVLRSTDGKNFAQIGEVTGSGTSTTPQSYNFLDQDVSSGVYYYQLRQVDYDGKSELSNIISVEIGNAAVLNVGLFYPNPTQYSSTVNITSPKADDMVFTLYSIDGKQALSKVYSIAKGDNRIDINLDRVPAGSYIGIFQTQGQTINRKLVVQD